MKKRLLLVLAMAIVMSLAFAVNAFAADEFVIHAKAPAEWSAPGLWAWGANGNVFESWPGQTMTADADNAGWYYFSVPSWTANAIVNGGGAQTVDLAIESKEVWITVGAAGGDGKYAADIAYSAPAGFTAAAAPAADAAATDAPKTGVIGLGLVYGLGALATGAVALKKRNK